MKRFFESMHVLGQIIGLMMGSNFTVPCDETIGYYRCPRYEF